VRTSLFAIARVGCTRNRFSVIVYGREGKFAIFLDMSLSFSLHDMVDGSESGADPHETWRGNSTACGIPNGVYLRLEQPTATKAPLA
jgi:hypothetical protein